MTFWPSMNWCTDGIDVVEPAQWRQFDGLVGVLWKAESQDNARGYYLAEDPRVVIYFDDVSPWQTWSDLSGNPYCCEKPILQASYIPAGLPMWTSIREKRRFSHLNIHIHKDRLLRFLTPTIGSSAAASALKCPVELKDAGPLKTLARLFADEISVQNRHSVFAEYIAGSIVTGLLDIQDSDGDGPGKTLTPAQMARIHTLFEEAGLSRLPVSEMARAVGISESWFSQVFKRTTGEGPLQWQLSKRIGAVKIMLRENDLPLADIAFQCGFTDQSHLTKSFKQAVGLPPARWKRMHAPE